MTCPLLSCFYDHCSFPEKVVLNKIHGTLSNTMDEDDCERAVTIADGGDIVLSVGAKYVQ